MIPFGSQRGYGDDLATHLMNAHDNEHVELFALRGSVAQDLHGAFSEWQAQGELLTRCQNHFYSLSVNPDQSQGRLSREQYIEYIDRAESALGLADQPRAVIFHEKYGREHAHVVWSRIDVDNEKAIHIAFDREKLMRITREFARDHDLELPEGYSKRGRGKQLSLYDLEQERLTGISKEQHIECVTACWQSADSARSFVHAISEQGYLLATGKRPYVLVDLYGGQHALPRLIDDKQVRTKDVAGFLEKEFPISDLPSVDEAKKLVSEHLRNIKSAQKDRVDEEQRAALLAEQKERMAQLVAEKEKLGRAQRQRMQAFFEDKRRERDEHRAAYFEQKQRILDEREASKSKGIQAAIEKYTGIEALRARIHRHNDKKRLDEHQRQKAELLKSQEQQRQMLALRQEIERREVERKIRSAEKIAQRELKSLAREDLRDERTAQRLDNHSVRSLSHLLDRQAASADRKPPRFKKGQDKDLDYER